MKNSLLFIRSIIAVFCVIFLTLYTSTTISDGINFASVVIGISSGLALAGFLILLDLYLKRFSLRTFNIALLGLFLGYGMGQAIMWPFQALLAFTAVSISSDVASLLKIFTILSACYFGMVATIRASEDLYFSIPFIRFKPTAPKKKDIVIDWTILMETRILDLAASGLLDDCLIVPRFMLKELYIMLESSDEGNRNRAKRCLDNFRKLEEISTLDLKYSETDYPSIQDSSLKTLQLAQSLNANVITSDITRYQFGITEGIRLINIHLLAHVLKPITGEQLQIKIQRYGKEPRQGVGYLEDGTMVVVNGGAEYIGEVVKAYVLSVKHTSSGRMIFSNVAEDSPFGESVDHAYQPPECETSQKSYFTL